MNQQQPHNRAKAHTLTHSPWPLFCGDLAFSQSWLLQRWSTAHEIRPHWAHWGLGLGLVRETQALCDPGFTRLGDKTKAQLRYRIACLQLAKDPYLELMPPDLLRAQTAQWINAPGATPIAVHGGLGDHLQLISLLATCVEMFGCPIRLEADGARVDQLKRCCAELTWLELQPRQQPLSAYHFLQTNASAVLSRLGVYQHRSWLHLAKSAKQRDDGLLCCWRATGQADPFSAWSRSVDFVSVVQFYKNFREQYSSINPGHSAEIIDITAWQPWECERLRSMGILLRNPASGDLLDLATLGHSKRIITIDTALAHLCAAMAKEALVLLPMFGDERWKRLLHTGQSYADHLKILRQRQFGCWQAPLAQALECLRQGPRHKQTQPAASTGVPIRP